MKARVPRRVFPAAAALWAALAAGCSDTKVTGTSTTTGNTISARAVLSDGSAAAGATVSIREKGSLPEGVPGSKGAALSLVLATDSTGFFSATVPRGGEYFLAIYASGRGGAEVCWQEDVLPREPSIAKAVADTLRLQKAASLSGTIAPGPDSVWLGFSGTARFLRLTGGGSFRFDSLPPGSRTLRAIRAGSAGPRTLDVAGWTALAGDTVVLDTLVLPADTAIHSLSLPACLDHIDSIAYAPGRPGPSDPRRILRSVTLSHPREWMELDACLGVWTRKGTLPDSARGTFQLLGGPGWDYLAIPDSGRLIRLDASGFRFLSPFPDSLVQAAYRGGRYYAYFHKDSVLRAFPDETAWMEKRPDRRFPKPESFQRFAVTDSAILYLVPDGAGAALSRFGFASASFQPGKAVQDFSGACVGMAAGTGEDVWLLNDARELYRVDGHTGTVLSRARIAAPDSLRGLAGPWSP